MQILQILVSKQILQILIIKQILQILQIIQTIHIILTLVTYVLMVRFSASMMKAYIRHISSYESYRSHKSHRSDKSQLRHKSHKSYKSYTRYEVQYIVLTLVTNVLMVLFSASMMIASPSFKRAIVPPSCASGVMCPMMNLPVQAIKKSQHQIFKKTEKRVNKKRIKPSQRLGPMRNLPVLLIRRQTRSRSWLVVVRLSV